MDINEFAVLKLFVVGVLINVGMMRGLSASDSFSTEPTPPRVRKVCNESRLQWEVEVCGEGFKEDMTHIDPQNWCNLTHFISEYHLFTLCTETKSQIVDCYWPNPLVERYIIHIHKHFFSNCTIDQPVWLDPPDDTLTILILIPVFLTLAMIGLVVWCSKRSDILA
ncbi:receptor activity-modifying protein 3 [Maylandia zebra]|uniref:Receptor activity-modifying protein 3 n=4 Tax=Haplochromini TaxID=319058 RepID=A0A3B4G7S1_9CICH|nr:receptor activity-modifying protein 3 [Maylandia zebra]XP_005744916.1 PREDICTED: receptor activity-modifying protein 3-like [Pundamilia nyererei]XP_026035024.1 receptor activity-modifying protein 3-like isoform X1 [Astatotilapia calliptera]